MAKGVLNPEINLSSLGDKEWRLNPGAEVRRQVCAPGGTGFPRLTLESGHYLIVRGELNEGNRVEGWVVEEVVDQRWLGMVGRRVKFELGQGEGLIIVAPRRGRG